MSKIRRARIKLHHLMAKFAESHSIVGGDTLSELASKYYGNMDLWPLMWSANGRPDPDNIPVGTELKIPPKRPLNSDEKEALKENKEKWSGGFRPFSPGPGYTQRNDNHSNPGEYEESEDAEKYQTDENMDKEEAFRKMFSYARAWKGTPYGWGGAGKGQWNLELPTQRDMQEWRGKLRGRPRKTVDPNTGIDCSGFIQKVLAIGGVTIPHDMTAASMYGYLSSHGTKLSGPEPGAIIFFSGRSGISHIGIIAENGNILESRGGAGVTDNLDPTARANMGKAYIMPDYPFMKKDLLA